MAENNKTFSNKQEKMVAKELGGYPIGGSGAMPGAPGDVKTYEWLVECKTHTKPDHTIFFDLGVWDKIQKEAMAMHRKPVLIVDDGSQSASKTWCLCRSANINLSGVVTTDLPVTIKKNISCKHEKLQTSLKEQTKKIVIQGGFYETAVYEANWGGEDVIVLPLATFKELFEK